MKKEIVYKGAHLTKYGWELLIWQSGAQAFRYFGDLKFWAKKQCVQQGFTKKSITRSPS